MRKRLATAIAMVLTFAIIFTGVPAMSGSLESSAASSYLKKLSASATGQTSVSLSWNKLSKKQQKKVKGITVFRDGVAIKNLKKSAKSFTDTGLTAGTTYRYQVKTYKTKTTKLWLNKKTGQYQKKKPKKKICGKSKKVVTYKFGNPSPSVSVTTVSAPLAAPSLSGKADSATSITLNWNAVPSATGYNLYRNNSKITSVSGTSYTDKVSPNTSYNYIVEATNGSTSAKSAQITVKTPVDQNQTAEIKKKIAELDTKIADVNNKISAKEAENNSAKAELNEAKKAYDNIGREFINSRARSLGKKTYDVLPNRDDSTYTRVEAYGDLDFYVNHSAVDYYLKTKITLNGEYYEALNRRLTVESIRRAIGDMKDLNEYRKSEGVAPLKVNYELMAFAAASGNSRLIHTYFYHRPMPLVTEQASEMLADNCADFKPWIKHCLDQEKDQIARGLVKVEESHYGDAIKPQWKSIGASYAGNMAGRNCVAYSSAEGSVDVDTFEKDFNSFIKSAETRYTNAKNAASSTASALESLKAEKSSLETQRNELAKQL